MHMVARALIFMLCLSAAPAAADDSAEANKIFVEAMRLIQGALQKPEGLPYLEDLENGIARLKEIMEKYPGSDLAVRLISGDPVVGGVSLQQIEEFTKEKRRDILIWLCSSELAPPSSLDPFSDERCKPYLDVVAARYVNTREDFDGALTLAHMIEDVSMRDSAFVSVGMAWIKARDFKSAIDLTPEIGDPDRSDLLLKYAAEERGKAEGLEAGYATAALIEDEATRQEALYRVDRMRSDDMKNQLFRGRGDIDAAFAMVPELKSSKARDELLQRMVWTMLKQRDLEAWLPRALEAATRVTDVRDRDSSLRDVAEGHARLEEVNEILSIADLASETGVQRGWILLIAVRTYTSLEDIESARNLADRIVEEEPKSRALRFIVRAEERLERRQ